MQYKANHSLWNVETKLHQLNSISHWVVSMLSAIKYINTQYARFPFNRHEAGSSWNEQRFSWMCMAIFRYYSLHSNFDWLHILSMVLSIWWKVANPNSTQIYVSNYFCPLLDNIKSIVLCASVNLYTWNIEMKV